MRYFISYSRRDLDFVMQLATDLRQNGIDIWLDKFDIPIGQPWDREIQDALKACQGFIFVISPDSVASENVMDEVSYAIGEDKQIIPIYYRACDVPFRVRRLQRVDFTGNYDDVLKNLLIRLNNEQLVMPVTPAMQSAAPTVPSQQAQPSATSINIAPTVSTSAKLGKRIGCFVSVSVAATVAFSILFAAFIYIPRLRSPQNIAEEEVNAVEAASTAVAISTSEVVALTNTPVATLLPAIATQAATPQSTQPSNLASFEFANNIGNAQWLLNNDRLGVSDIPFFAWSRNGHDTFDVSAYSNSDSNVILEMQPKPDAELCGLYKLPEVIESGAVFTADIGTFEANAQAQVEYTIRVQKSEEVIVAEHDFTLDQRSVGFKEIQLDLNDYSGYQFIALCVTDLQSDDEHPIAMWIAPRLHQ